VSRPEKECSRSASCAAIRLARATNRIRSENSADSRTWAQMVLIWASRDMDQTTGHRFHELKMAVLEFIARSRILKLTIFWCDSSA